MRKFFTMLVLCLLALCLPACATTSGSSPGSGRAETYQPSNFLISNQTSGLVLKLEVEDANGKAELRLADRETYTYERPSTEPIVFGSQGQRTVAIFTVTAFERTEKGGPDTLVQVGEPVRRVLRASDLNWFWNVHRSSFGLKELEPDAVAKKRIPHPLDRNFAPAKVITFANTCDVEVEVFNDAGVTIVCLKPGERFSYTGPDGVEERFFYQSRRPTGVVLYEAGFMGFDHANGVNHLWRIFSGQFENSPSSSKRAEEAEREQREEERRKKEEWRKESAAEKIWPHSRSRGNHDW